MTELLKRPSFQIHLQCGQQHSASFGFRGSAQFSVTVPIAANFSRERRCHFNLTFSCANHESRRSAREKSADIEHQFFSESHPNPIEMAATGKLATLTGNLLAQARPKLQVAAKYALAELTPPKISDIPAIRAGFVKLIKGAQTGAWKNTTVREGWLNALVTVEVLCWFYVGECIGKRHYVGYNI